MKMKKLFLLLGLMFPAFSHAQTYSIGWFKIAGGGGSSAGANGGVVMSLSGAIGQQDASGAMTGNAYSLTGGFWSLVASVQSAGASRTSQLHGEFYPGFGTTGVWNAC